MRLSGVALLRLYAPWEAGPDGYPLAWHHSTAYGGYPAGHSLANPPIKDLIRMQAENRCQRCLHPYTKGEHPVDENGESWSPCDERCRHGGPFRFRGEISGKLVRVYQLNVQMAPGTKEVHALWRVLTVHHLDEDKLNCRWWNLVALCQRCHLRMQRAVVMDRPYLYEHSEWFKPYAAGFYAWKYLGKELGRGETLERLPQLLALEHRFTQEALL